MRRGGRRERGTTLAELLFTVALTVTVVGAATALYASAAAGVLDTAATVETGTGAGAVAREVDFYIRSALDAQVVTIASRPVLKLTMPAVRDPRDGRGMVTGYSPSYVHPRLGPAYETGETVWIYAGGVPSGTFPSISTAGDVPYLARRADGLQPGAADVDRNWTFLDGANVVRRFPGSFTFSFTRTARSPVVSWTVSTIAGSSGAASVYDAGRPSSFRAVQVSGTTSLLSAAPQ